MHQLHLSFTISFTYKLIKTHYRVRKHACTDVHSLIHLHYLLDREYATHRSQSVQRDTGVPCLFPTLIYPSPFPRGNQPSTAHCASACCHHAVHFWCTRLHGAYMVHKSSNVDLPLYTSDAWDTMVYGSPTWCSSGARLHGACLVHKITWCSLLYLGECLVHDILGVRLMHVDTPWRTSFLW